MDAVRHLSHLVLTLAGIESEVSVALLSGPTCLAVRHQLVDRLVRQVAQVAGLDLPRDAQGPQLLASFFLPNGARCYEDHHYGEYATPPLDDTALVVAAVAAGDQLMRQAAEQLAAHGQTPLLLVRNNVDHRGHSCGAHVNVRLSRAGFQQIFANDELLHNTVLPLFVTLPLICGSGGPWQESGRDGYQIWQRAPFLKTLVSEQTMFDRPLVNTRDECLAADADHFARLHIIHLDANRLEVAEYCKLGLLRLLCATIDALVAPSFELALADPLAAVTQVSREPQSLLPLADGRRMAPVDVLRRFVDVFHRLSDLGLFEGRVADAELILAEVDRVLAGLSADPFDLHDSLDWVAKFITLDDYRTRHQLAWSDPRIQWLDIQYHALTGDSATRRLGRRVTSDLQIERLAGGPPRGLRSEVRGALIRRFADDIAVTDWHFLVSRVSGVAYLLPDDPPAGAAAVIGRAHTLDEACLRLGLRQAVLSSPQDAAAWPRGDAEPQLETSSP